MQILDVLKCAPTLSPTPETNSLEDISPCLLNIEWHEIYSSEYMGATIACRARAYAPYAGVLWYCVVFCEELGSAR
jgi:hypothetical protein